MGDCLNPFGMMSWLVHSFGKFAIAAWYGSIESIPDNWIICDGTNGTPDLRDRFLVGAGDSYDPGDTGGAKAAEITGTTDGHAHMIPEGNDLVEDGSPMKHYMTNSNTANFTGVNPDNRPPFHGLVYIMHT